MANILTKNQFWLFDAPIFSPKPRENIRCLSLIKHSAEAFYHPRLFPPPSAAHCLHSSAVKKKKEQSFTDGSRFKCRKKSFKMCVQKCMVSLNTHRLSWARPRHKCQIVQRRAAVYGACCKRPRAISAILNHHSRPSVCLSLLTLKNGEEAKDTLTLLKRIYTTTTTTTTTRGCNCLAFFVDFCSAPLRPGADGTKMCSPA